jgi:hypothetical protein
MGKSKMKIIINDFGVIDYRYRLAIVDEYIKQYSYRECERDIWGLLGDKYYIKETGKNPVKVAYDRNYHVLCKKTRTSYIFKIWLAV